jgi:hypothetical protein
VEIARKQADELLQSLEEFYPIPRAGMDLAATISANAQRAQIEAEKRFALSLTIDASGVKALRDLLSALHAAMLPSRFARFFGAKIFFPPSVLIANVFGAFLGEALRTRVGGEWQLVDCNRQTLVALCRDTGNFCLPTYRAGKQFMNGQADDVWFFYAVMVQKLDPTASEGIRSINTDDLKDPAEFARKWEEIFGNRRPANRPASQ